MTATEFWTVAAIITVPIVVLTAIAFVLDAVLAADAKRREAESAEFVTFAEDYS